MIMGYAYDYHWNLEGWGDKTRIPTEEDLEKTLKDVVNRISQLLSERTKEAKQEKIEDFISELECWKVAWIDRTKDNGAEYLRDGLLKMLNKDLSKLLKEEE